MTTAGLPEPAKPEDNPYAAPTAELRPSDLSRAGSAAAAVVCHGMGVLSLWTFWVPGLGLLFAIASFDQGRRVWTPEHKRLARLGMTYSAIAGVVNLAFLGLLLLV